MQELHPMNFCDEVHFHSKFLAKLQFYQINKMNNIIN